MCVQRALVSQNSALDKSLRAQRSKACDFVASTAGLPKVSAESRLRSQYFRKG